MDVDDANLKILVSLAVGMSLTKVGSTVNRQILYDAAYRVDPESACRAEAFIRATPNIELDKEILSLYPDCEKD